MTRIHRYSDLRDFRGFGGPASSIGRYLTVLCTAILLVSSAQALHSPGDWYAPFPLDDGDGDKIEDMIQNRRGNEVFDAIICFLDDCIPPQRLAELECLGDIGYSSTVVASIQLKNTTMEKLSLIAQWPEVGYIHQDHVFIPMMTRAGQALKAHAGFYSPNTAEDQGFDGTGITIAVLDTGCDDPGGPGTTHSHLPTAVGGLFIDAASNLAVGNPDDQQSHGTAVAGCALGRGDGSGNNRGVAPGASLFDCRITPPGGGGSTTSSNIQKVVDWLTWNHNSVVPPVRVANISFGSMTPSAGSALTASIEALVASGVFVAVSAGNQDTCAGTGIGHIAVTTRAITVAAASHENNADRTNDVIANYSGTGPGLGLSPKPDITAYGNQCPINCAFPGSCAGPSTSVIRAPAFNTATSYLDFGGTSAASPMVAGAGALIIERNPAISPAAVKKLLMDNAEDRGAAGWDAVWGAGLMDLGPIFQAPPPVCDLRVQSVTYSPSTVQCFNPVTITITVENVGAVPVTDFSVDWERWYFGPSQPAQRLPIGAGPQANTAGPLAPGGTRTFNRTWTPGVSDNLPLSQHSCFWGIVHAACDNNASNNERNVNVTIVGVSGYSCRTGRPTEQVVFGAGNGPCTVPDNGNGTVSLPPVGCAYLSPDQVHMIINGLPPGTTIELAPIHKDFICRQGGSPNNCGVPGGSLGGEIEQFDSVLAFNVRGTGALAGFNRNIEVPIFCETHTGPRNPGDPVQIFPTDMFRLQGQLFGDPDFCTLRVTGGTAFNMPSPGRTTLTQQPNGDFQVDSFFDITYRIEFEGCFGSPLDGYAGATNGTLRMESRNEVGGDMVEFKFRLGHNHFGKVREQLQLFNEDPDNWQVELEVQGQAGQVVYADVDNQECAVWGTLRAIRLNPTAPPVNVFVVAFDEVGQYIGDMQVRVQLDDPNAGACYLPSGGCIITTREECLQLMGFFQGPGTVCDVRSGDRGPGVFCGDTVCDPALGEGPCNCPADCGPPTAEYCNDDVDNDCDSLVDCGDPDCGNDPACEPPVACCLPDGSCVDFSRLDCFCSDGTPQPFGTDCSTISCAPGCASTSVCPNADVDCNNIVNALDIAIIASSANFGKTTDQAAQPRADVDGNGIINALDIAVAASSSCFGR